MSTYSWFRGCIAGMIMAQHERYLLFLPFLYLETVAKRGNAYVMILTAILAYKWMKAKIVLEQIENCIQE